MGRTFRPRKHNLGKTYWDVAIKPLPSGTIPERFSKCRGFVNWYPSRDVNGDCSFSSRRTDRPIGILGFIFFVFGFLVWKFAPLRVEITEVSERHSRRSRDMPDFKTKGLQPLKLLSSA